MYDIWLNRAEILSAFAQLWWLAQRSCLHISVEWIKVSFELHSCSCVIMTVIWLSSKTCKLTCLVENKETESDCSKDHMGGYQDAWGRKGSFKQQGKQPTSCSIHRKLHWPLLSPLDSGLPCTQWRIFSCHCLLVPVESIWLEEHQSQSTASTASSNFSVWVMALLPTRHTQYWALLLKRQEV